MVNVAKMVINAYDSVNYGDPDKVERAKDMEDAITNTINNTLSSVSGILGMLVIFSSPGLIQRFLISLGNTLRSL